MCVCVCHPAAAVNCMGAYCLRYFGSMHDLSSSLQNLRTHKDLLVSHKKSASAIKVKVVRIYLYFSVWLVFMLEICPSILEKEN
jgi:hypothetical protein